MWKARQTVLRLAKLRAENCGSRSAGYPALLTWSPVAIASLLHVQTCSKPTKSAQCLNFFHICTNPTWMPLNSMFFCCLLSISRLCSVLRPVLRFIHVQRRHHPRTGLCNPTKPFLPDFGSAPGLLSGQKRARTYARKCVCVCICMFGLGRQRSRASGCEPLCYSWLKRLPLRSRSNPQPRTSPCKPLS